MECTNVLTGYRLKSLEDSSHKYGQCEVCGRHSSEIFLQSERRRTVFYADGKKYDFTKKENYVAGHKECLLAIRIHNQEV